jgi:MYXO-CTERM domain-containing protein
VVAALAVCGALLAAPDPALAFCRAGVDPGANAPCVDDPDVPRVHWLRGCVQYHLSPKLFAEIPLLDEGQIRDDVASAFATWNAVDCDREPIRVEASHDATEESAAFDFDRVDESIVSAHARDEWRELGYDASALGLTFLFVNPKDGEIYDADIEINAGDGGVTHCDQHCDSDQFDLRNTLQHETGHYLGLGHSDVDGATMAPYAPGGDVDKITLELDDERGICAVQMPKPNDECETPLYPKVIRRQARRTGCAVSSAGAGSGGAGWTAGALVLLACVQRRRRRRARSLGSSGR